MKRIQTSSLHHKIIKQTISYQFSLTLKEVNKLIPSHIEIEISRKTNRIRYIYLKDDLWGIIRPNDGFFLLTPNSAKFLIKNLEFPRMRVVIQSDVSEYIQKGRNVFAKHVVDCDPIIIPFSEVIVVNENDKPLAIGSAQLNKEEILSFTEGIAVKVRKGILN
ncbi:MAG: PUA domain-containing protein [Promethearchaeota archaeon]